MVAGLTLPFSGQEVYPPAQVWAMRSMWDGASSAVDGVAAIPYRLLQVARKYNFERYDYQGIATSRTASTRGELLILQVQANLVPESAFRSGARPSSIDAAI